MHEQLRNRVATRREAALSTLARVRRRSQCLAGDLRASRARLSRVLGVVGAQARVDQAVHRRRWNGTNRSRGGSATGSSTCRSTASTVTCATATATRSRTTSKGSQATAERLRYRELLDDVNRFANGLRTLGINRGDRVAIYMPMIPELPVAMLACARIGAAHSVIFGGFSPESIVDRVNDASCVALITADYGWRRGDKVPLKRNCDIAMEQNALDPALHRGAARRRRSLHARGARLLVGRGVADQAAECGRRR